MKKFWKKTEGFTLVELVVVIAILGILAGVGTVGYSGYVKKANMAADQQLASSIANALQLHYYANPTEATSGYVILSTEKTEADTADGFAAKAMTAAFGEGWDNLVLKHNGWKKGVSKEVADAYNVSTFKGKEKSLLNQVGSLTGQLSELLGKYTSLVGDKFNGYLSDNGLANASYMEKSNAAVLYAADRFSEADENKIADAFTTFYSGGGWDMNSLINTLSMDVEAGGCGLGYFGACVAMYAQAEAFGQYMNEKDPTILSEFHNFEIGATDDGQVDGLVVATQVGQALQDVVYKAYENIDVAAYYALEGPATTDTKAFLAAMDAIKDNEVYLLDRVGKDGCYTDGVAEGLLNSYLAAAEADVQEGEIFIHINPTAGAKLVNILPTELEKELG